MNFKTTYVLFGLLVVMLGALFVVLIQGDSGAAAEGVIFPSFKDKSDPLKASDIATVRIERLKPDAPALQFERDGSNNKGWKLTEPRALPAEGLRVDELIDQLAAAKVAEDIRTPTRKDAGLDAPSRVVKLTTTEGKELKLTIGEVTTGGGSAVAYVSTSDLPGKVLPVKRDSIATALEGINYFRGKELLGDAASWQSVKLSRSDKKEAVELQKVSDRWRMTQPNYGVVDVQRLLDSLGNLRLTHIDDKKSDFVADDTADLAKYNLQESPKSPVLSVQVTRAGQKVPVTLLVGVGKREEDKFFAALKTDPKQAKFDVVKVTAQPVEEVNRVLDNPKDLRSKVLVELDGKTPDAIDIVHGQATLEFRREGLDGWQLYRGDKAVKVDRAAMDRLLNELNNRSPAASFPEGKTPADLGVDRPGVVVRVYADSLKPAAAAGDDKDKKKEAKPTPSPEKLVATLKFGLKDPQDRSRVGMERLWGKDSTLMYVPVSTYEVADQGAVAYLEKTLDPFNPGSAEENVTQVKLEVAGQKEPTVLTREKDGAWAFTSPAALKGQKANAGAVNGLLAALNRPQVVALVNESPAAGDLTSYGLSPAAVRVQVTVSKDKKPVAYTFDLGKTEPGKGVYFKPGNKEMVYQVGERALESAKAELRDRTILSFNPDDVVELQVSHFVRRKGDVETTTLVRKDNKWAVKDAPKAAVDEAATVSAVRALSVLSAASFPSEAKGTDLKGGAVKLVVVLKDKKNHEVTLGEQAADGLSVTNGGRPFVVRDETLAEVRKKNVDYFVK